MKRILITTEQGDNCLRYFASISGQKYKAAGNSKDQAVGTLVMSFPEEFDVVIEDEEINSEGSEAKRQENAKG
jgi:hypothetical protein